MSSLLRRAIVYAAIAAACLGAFALFAAYQAGRIERAHPPSGRFVDVDGGRLHVVVLGAADATPVVLLHGSSTNLGDMRLALGDRLAARFRVILIDRPGHGWSDRPDGRADASPARQAKLVRQALQRIGVTRPILVAHSWSGALATAYALSYPRDVAGLVLLAPVTHPWPETSAWYDNIISGLLAESARTAGAPVIGPLFARTLALPLGELLIGPAVQSVFAPDAPPPDYLARTGGALLLRPGAFAANAQDLAAIEDFVKAQAPNYLKIMTPAVIIAGDADVTVPTSVHAEAIAAAMPNAKLIVLPGVGHMVHYAAPERIVAAIAELAETARPIP